MKKRRVFYVMCSVLKLRAINRTNENRQIIKLQPIKFWRCLVCCRWQLISEFGPGSLEIAARSRSLSAALTKMNIRDSEDASDFILSRHDFSTPVNNVRPLFAVSTSPSTPRRQTLEENEEVFRTPGFSSNQTPRRRTILITTPTNTPEQHRNDGQTPSIFRTPGFSQLSSNQSRNSLLLTPTANTNQRVPFTPVRNYELRSCRGGSKTSLLRQVPEISTPKIPRRQEDPPSPCSLVPQMGAGGDMVHSVWFISNPTYLGLFRICLIFTL